MGRILPYLFPHLRGPHKGKRIRELKRAWRSACVEGGAAACSDMTSGGPP